MPKRVDHHERRVRIADALLRVAADDGVEAVSLRHVAAAAGVTTGMVQHYFRTKEEMLLFALEAVSERVEARIAAHPRGALELVRALLVEQLPLDETRRAEGRVALAFQAAATHSEAIAAKLREASEGLRAHLAGLLREVTSADPHQTATALLALVEGLGMQAVTGNYPPEEALSVLEAHLELVTG
ncbi:TetR/AcrR family transcriptional regulator [Amycolatopsis magusensis]|uniref:TetR/AcrR family transcriptional regulator n=1 Tax=Amycolatopsis magusensis TaxID=882444 RepID=UPI0037ABAD36